MCIRDSNCFTWFNMGRITKDGRCLITGLQTEKKWGDDKCLIKEFPRKSWSLSVSLEQQCLLNITVIFKIADGPLTSINQTCIDISSSVCVFC